MLLTLVLGMTVGIAGMILIRQWIDGALAQRAEAVLRPSEFPRLAPPVRPMTAARRRAA